MRAQNMFMQEVQRLSCASHVGYVIDIADGKMGGFRWCTLRLNISVVGFQLCQHDRVKKEKNLRTPPKFHINALKTNKSAKLPRNCEPK